MNFLVTYVTIEDISSGLFRTQIIDLLKVFSDKSNLKFEVIVLNAPWKYKQNKRSLKEYRLELKEYPITIKYYSLLPPMRYCTKSSIYLSLSILLISTIFKLTISGKTKILHCRSYMATYCTNLVTKKPIIFDMRSLWVLENISTGNIKNNTLVHKYWSYIESQCIKNSVVSTAVSKWMIDYLSLKVHSSNLRLIPIGVDTSNFFYDIKLAKQLRRELEIENELVIVYSGSLGLSGVNIEALCNIITKIISTKVNFKIVFITNEPKRSVDKILKCIPKNIDSIIVSPRQRDINKWLSIGDIGIHALPKQLDSNSRLGTKIVEYWANGMPVIVNNHVGDAATYIRNRGVGIVLSDEEFNLKDLEEFLNFPDHRKAYKKKCMQVVEENFDMQLISDKYLRCYFDIIQSRPA
jgi:glycosyltransferase involved in cell wall biosynthesis